MKKRKLLALLLILIITVSLGACNGAGNGNDKDNVGNDGKTSLGTAVDIHVASWNNAADNLSEIAEKFNAANGDKGKVIIDYSDSDYSKLKPALASGNGVPDIFQTQSRDIPAFFNSYGLRAFADLSDIIADDAENWVDFALETCKGEDGKYYAIPWDIGPVGLYYRADIFEEAGIDVNTLTTWDKYIEAGKLLRTKGDYYVEAFNFNGATSTDEFLIYFNQLGGQFYDENGNVNLASEEMIRAAELCLKMIDAGVAMDIPNAWDDRIAAINENRLVAFPYPAWYMGTMKNSCENTAGKWRITKIPAFEEGGNVYANAGGSVLAVSSTTKNLDLAKRFLEYAIKSKEGSDINMKYGEFPSYKPAYETEYFKSKDEYFGGLEVGTIFAGLTGAPATKWGPYFTDVSESMKTAAGNILANRMDPRQALEAATKDAQSKINAK
ncbi:hypothetical protein CDQ84_08355 [Clostridium thermosuccinogenes]|jgi:lactose/L-arabinose transport system substrate-binding protein|uniref:Sugar ABC transporter substrate-binding protein n=1 Tax=Clostridium thermosuccinogenes TaxID=84032 RepID=A0A2K2FF84_9CLOT|nr:extracellular solute-binding protein [Pseudoclostridium thermosuccinogenes]AUS97573.1 hypothetical protein CDO33_14650 [Pseudoclostridium thermosuccinogenes]PNT97437.1 hypothetical protein CDQ85_08200 [Pseudoclostridium thermosuccinogenes]PNT99469.1 hypothetical protein CDQ84_08355 [Pseudoclostridium thermosuccinogenes]